jgi:hypothetical protein
MIEITDMPDNPWQMTDAEVLATLRSNGPFGKALRTFSDACGESEQAAMQRKPPTPLEARRMQIAATLRIIKALTP